MAKSGIKPENLPAEDDVKKLERRIKSEQNKIYYPPFKKVK